MEKYEPELGQAIFGQPTQALEVPAYVEAVLTMIREEVQRVEWNNRQEEFDPFGNTGDQYKNDTFVVNSYSWNEEENQPYNFKWKDFELSWYKYFGRGMSMNREMTPDESAMMLEECLEAARKQEKDLYEGDH